MCFSIKINPAHSFLFYFHIKTYNSSFFSTGAPFYSFLYSRHHSFEPCPLVCSFVLFFCLMLCLCRCLSLVERNTVQDQWRLKSFKSKCWRFWVVFIWNKGKYISWSYFILITFIYYMFACINLMGLLSLLFILVLR